MKRLGLILTALLCFASPSFAQHEQLASATSPRFANLRPLTNGLSALSLMWPLNSLAENRIDAAHAGLATVLGGATDTLTAFEAETYREINGINLGITLLPKHIMMTMTAPHDAFPDALTHMGQLLTNPNFSHPWYARQSVQQRPLLATKTRRPENVMGVLADFILFPEADDGTDTSEMTFSFGMPSQVVIRSESSETEARLTKILRQLPLKQDAENTTSPPSVKIPKGVIFAPDPDSRETLIFVVKSETFDGPDDFVGANLLMDYIGAYQGSEMFRVIRQELRAAYSPASEFEQIGKNRAIMGLSATVLSDEWPAILAEMQGIYTDVRQGIATDQGLNNNRRRLLGALDWRFSSNPSWGASQFMNEYAQGSTGDIRFPLFNAIVNADFKKIRTNADDHLPPMEDYLVILIGGTNPPPEAMKEGGFCEQPLSKPLRHCLTQMQ